MRKFGSQLLALTALAATFAAAQIAAAGTIYVVSVSNSNGEIYAYDNMSDLSAQSPSNVTGDLVATHAAYFNDQGVTMDFNSGIVYRIANNGNVFQYPTLNDWLANTNSSNVSIGTNPFSNANMKRVNDVSYDGGTGNFYGVGASSNSSTPGDVLVYSSLNNFKSAAQTTPYGDSTYGAARAMFWNSETVSGTTVGSMTVPSKSISASYFQISGAGRLEGFESLADYAATASNRINLGPEGAFGGTNTTGFQALVAFATPIPEPASLVLCMGAVVGLFAVRRR